MTATLPLTKRAPRIPWIAVIAVVLSFATTAGGSWVSASMNAATLRARMDASDKLIEINRLRVEEMVPEKQFTLAITDMKSELDEVKADVKEIRRATAPRR